MALHLEKTNWSLGGNSDTMDIFYSVKVIDLSLQREIPTLGVGLPFLPAKSQPEPVSSSL